MKIIDSFLSLFRTTEIMTDQNIKTDSGNTDKKTELFIIISLIVFAVIYKLFTLQMIYSGDSTTNWRIIRFLVNDLPYPLSHHSVRMGVILPPAFFTLFFGTHPLVYYIAPFLLSLIADVFVYKTARLFLSPLLSLVASIFVIIFPPLLRMQCNVHADGFSFVYVIIASYFLIKSLDDSTIGEKNIIISSVIFFIAYLTKDTNVFFMPGAVIIIWLNRKKLRPVVIFGCTFALLVLIEYIIYVTVTGNPLGRWGIVASSHVANALEKNRMWPVPFYGLFWRYTTMPAYWKWTFFLHIIAGVFILLRVKELKVKSIVILSFSFFFFTTFAVVSINPIIPAQPFQYRYLTVGVPYVVITVMYGLFYLCRLLNKENISRIRPVVYPAILIIILLIYIPLFMKFEKKAKSSVIEQLKYHPLVQVPYYHRILTKAYATGIPIIIGDEKKPHETRSAAHGLVQDVMISDKLLVKEGKYVIPVSVKKNINGISINILVDKQFSSDEYLDKYLADKNSTVILATIPGNSLTIDEMTFEKFLTRKPVKEKKQNQESETN